MIKTTPVVPPTPNLPVVQQVQQVLADVICRGLCALLAWLARKLI